MRNMRTIHQAIFRKETVNIALTPDILGFILDNHCFAIVSDTNHDIFSHLPTGKNEDISNDEWVGLCPLVREANSLDVPVTNVEPGQYCVLHIKIQPHIKFYCDATKGGWRRILSHGHASAPNMRLWRLLSKYKYTQRRPGDKGKSGDLLDGRIWAHRDRTALTGRFQGQPDPEELHDLLGGRSCAHRDLTVLTGRSWTPRTSKIGRSIRHFVIRSFPTYSKFTGAILRSIS
jgi:hypothetical protein